MNQHTNWSQNNILVAATMHNSVFCNKSVSARYIPQLWGGALEIMHSSTRSSLSARYTKMTGNNFKSHHHAKFHLSRFGHLWDIIATTPIRCFSSLGGILPSIDAPLEPQLKIQVSPRWLYTHFELIFKLQACIAAFTSTAPNEKLDVFFTTYWGNLHWLIQENVIIGHWGDMPLLHYLLPPVKVSHSQMVLQPTYPYQIALAKTSHYGRDFVPYCIANKF